MITFSSGGIDLDSMFNDDTHEQTKIGGRCLPISALHKKGLTVSEYAPGEYKVKPTRMSVKSKLMSVDGVQFLEQILSECDGLECELRTQAKTNFWDIQKTSDNTFLIKKRGQ